MTSTGLLNGATSPAVALAPKFWVLSLFLWWVSDRAWAMGLACHVAFIWTRGGMSVEPLADGQSGGRVREATLDINEPTWWKGIGGGVGVLVEFCLQETKLSDPLLQSLPNVRRTHHLGFQGGCVGFHWFSRWDLVWMK